MSEENFIWSVTFSANISFAFPYLLLLYAVVLCPLSVTDGWVSEIVKFSPKLKVTKYVGGKEFRCSLRRDIYEHVKGQSTAVNVRQRLSCSFDC